MFELNLIDILVSSVLFVGVVFKIEFFGLL